MSNTAVAETDEERTVAAAAVQCLRLWNRVNEKDCGKLAESGGRTSTVCEIGSGSVRISINKMPDTVFVERADDPSFH